MGARKGQSGLESPSSRERLKRRSAPYWVRLAQGRHLGYRKGRTGGFWLARLTDRKTWTKVQESIGPADDLPVEAGVEALTYDQAADRARAWFKAMEEKEETRRRPVANTSAVTVAQAVESYIDYLYAEKKSGLSVEQAARMYIYPKPIGRYRVRDLTSKIIGDFRQAIADSPSSTRAKLKKPSSRRGAKPGPKPKDRPRLKGKRELEAESLSAQELEALRNRQRKATSNRILNILKSALNRLCKEHKELDYRAWRDVDPYRNADGVRTDFLEVEEQRLLIAACQGKFRDLVVGGLLTGARYGELCLARIRDVYVAQGAIRLADSKTSTPRTLILTQEGKAFFSRLIQGRPRNELVFLRDDGKPWGKSHTFVPLRQACERAGLRPICFHTLRHTYASHLVMSGADLTAVAKALGHSSTRMVAKHYGHLRPGWVHEQVEKHAPKLFLDAPSSGAADTSDGAKRSSRQLPRRITYTPEGEKRNW